MWLFSRERKQKDNSFDKIFSQSLEQSINPERIYIEQEEAEKNTNTYAFLEDIPIEEFSRRYSMELTIQIEKVNPKQIHEIMISYSNVEGMYQIRVDMTYDETTMCLSDLFQNPYAVMLLKNTASYDEEDIRKAVIGIKESLENIKWENYYPIKNKAIRIRKKDL